MEKDPSPPPPAVPTSSEDNSVRCPCGVNEVSCHGDVIPLLSPPPPLCCQDDGLMVLCGVCQVWQHSICFSLLDMEVVPDLHICVQCSKKGNKYKCTDPSLTKLNHTQLKVEEVLHVTTMIWSYLPSPLPPPACLSLASLPARLL